jgi:hypothetical protein
MSSQLKINIETRGEHRTKPGEPIQYNVKMSDPSLRSNDILYFSPTLSLTKKSIRSAVTDTNDMKIFTNPANLDKVLKYIISKGFQKTTVKKAKEKGVVMNNIKLLKSIYFPSRGKFFIDGKAYLINKSEIVKDSIKENKLNPTTGVPGEYDVTIKLSLLDARKKPGHIDFQRLSCKDKAEKIDNLAKELLGVSFGLYKDTAGPYNIQRPVLYSSDPTGYTESPDSLPPYSPEAQAQYPEPSAPPLNEPTGGTRTKKRKRRRRRKTRRKRN